MIEPFTSEQYQKRTAQGISGDECCLCGKPTLGQNGAIHVPVNHEKGCFVTEAQALKQGQAVSYYPIGPECAKKWSKEFDAHSVRFRRTAKGLVSYDNKPARA